MSMYFQHSPAIWQEFPELVPGVLLVDGISSDAQVEPRIDPFTARARERLAGETESALPEIRAWRHTFSNMGLKPTQYRCASESLLRRFRKDGALPHIHPLVDLCNAVSLACAIPVAVFDLANVDAWLEVRHAFGDETYTTFSGDSEHPDRGEVIFADATGHAHARRWTNRQSGRSAVRDTTSAVLIVAEAMHESAPSDVEHLINSLDTELRAIWPVVPATGILTAASPRFDLRG